MYKIVVLSTQWLEYTLVEVKVLVDSSKIKNYLILS